MICFTTMATSWKHIYIYIYIYIYMFVCVCVCVCVICKQIVCRNFVFKSRKLNGFKYSHQTLIILFNINQLFACG